MNIPRSYVINENNERIAVQLDLATFEKIEELLENQGHDMTSADNENLSA